MIEFIKGEGGGNDFVLIPHKDNFNFSKFASRILRRGFSVGGDGLIVMDGERMRFFNPDGREVPFCGNGVRVFFYLLYLQGKVKEKGEIKTGAGEVKLTCNDKGMVGALMPEIEIGRRMEEGVMIYCGVPHLVVHSDKVEDIDVEKEGKRLSTLQNGGNNVDWFSKDDGVLSVRTFERGVERETLSCASGIASVSYFLMKATGREKFRIKTKGGDFKAFLDNKLATRLWLKGNVKIVFKGNLLEKEESWVKEEIMI
ncbi:MAG: diaminopimelate epimerase [candidate division WOR-3 bacterium]|nr:diaminopimelate epimerase [candidate division WOR-3 bacterium]